uniref:phosphoglycerate mutase (2,3-diphosphoglycerate-dependent) n=1 Tax=Hyaloperonospora arabidopsidis (strain Emoy2) TaxID=559515 RepID=M4BY08_HYAAE
MKMLTGLASLALAAVVATLTNILVKQKRQRDVRACGCSDGECCNSVRSSERRYQLPRTHVVHWDTGKSECDPIWSEMVQERVVEEAQDHGLRSGGTLILLRHGQSVWNRKPDRPSDLWRYAGSIDIPLSEVGMQEALEAGKRLEFVPIDVVFCSQMDRARTTMSLALSLHSSKKTPVVEHCSPLEKPSFEGGVPSTKHIVMFNRERVQKIRNDFYTRFPGKNGESCEDIHNRTIPFFNSFIMPHLAAGRNVLVSSHGFVIRTLINAETRIATQVFRSCTSMTRANLPRSRRRAVTVQRA